MITRWTLKNDMAFVVNLLFCVFYLRFALIHLSAVAAGQWHVLPFVIQESLLAFFFLTRRPSQKTSYNPVDWIVAGVGSFAPLLITGGGVPYAIGVPLQMVGLALSITSLCYLGRSFGIVPSNRGIVVKGPYRYVRHPMYAAHMLTLTGYAFTYPNAHDGFLVVVTIVLLLFRVMTEELLLFEDPVYVLYAQFVPNVLIPGVL